MSDRTIARTRPGMLRHPIHLGLGLVALTVAPAAAWAADAYLPIVLPVTGFMSVEGGSQRNGALMAIEHAPASLKAEAPVFDTGTSATGAATALDKALSEKPALAASVSVFGTEMVAMAPMAQDYQVPLLTISGLAQLTETGNPYIFRFLPNDREIKVAHARYVVEKLNKTKPALIGDTTAYGQGGFKLLQEDFAKLNINLAMAESVEPDTRDMSSIVAKIKESGADVLVIHTVAQPMALLIKQARTAGLDIPIVTSSSLVEPQATALFDPAELKSTCSETPSAPEARATPEISAWADAYEARFKQPPDGLALGQYDGVMMALSLIAGGATTPDLLAKALNTTTYKGVAMTYKSNGKGDMAHNAEIVCWDGTSRIPKIAADYSGDELTLK